MCNKCASWKLFEWLGNCNQNPKNHVPTNSTKSVCKKGNKLSIYAINNSHGHIGGVHGVAYSTVAEATVSTAVRIRFNTLQWQTSIIAILFKVGSNACSSSAIIDKRFTVRDDIVMSANIRLCTSLDIKTHHFSDEWIIIALHSHTLLLLLWEDIFKRDQNRNFLKPMAQWLESKLGSMFACV